MARKKDAEGQEMLIENDTPEIKTAKRLIKEYKKMREGFQFQHSTDRETLEKKQAKMVEAVQAAGLKPDAEGRYHIDMGDKTADVWQDSTFKIKFRNNKEDDTDFANEEDDDAGDE